MPLLFAALSSLTNNYEPKTDHPLTPPAPLLLPKPRPTEN